MEPPPTYTVTAVRTDGQRVILAVGLTRREARQYINLLDPAYSNYRIEIEPQLPPDSRQDIPVVVPPPKKST